MPFDVIGASYYGYWHGSLAALQFNLDDVTAHYDKDIIVVETAYAFILADDDNWGNIIGDPSQLVPGYPATPDGQAANFRDVMNDRPRRPERARARRLLLGSRRGPASWATAGARATPTLATHGRTRRSSTSTIGRSRR